MPFVEGDWEQWKGVRNILADADFIAAARSAVPALLIEVRRLRATLRSIRATAGEDLRRDACGASTWQIEADARAALDGPGE